MGRAAGQQKFLRARTPVACDAAFDNLGIDADEFGDEYEEALARYTALGLFDNLPEEVEEVDDDATPEEMAALSQEYLAAAAEEQARRDALMQKQLAAAAEAEERQRIAQWEEHFVNTLRTSSKASSPYPSTLQKSSSASMRRLEPSTFENR